MSAQQTVGIHEMKNRILSKNKGYLFFLLPKIYQLPEYYTMFARKIFFLLNWGGGATAPSLLPVSYAYGQVSPLVACLRTCACCLLSHSFV